MNKLMKELNIDMMNNVKTLSESATENERKIS